MLLVGLALAEPSRCQATWTAREQTCTLRGEQTAVGVAAGQKGAEKATLRQMERVIELGVASQLVRLPGVGRADVEACRADARANTHMSCFAAPELGAEALCFVELADTTCWDGTVLQVEGPGVESFNRARETMCEAVDARLVQLNYADVASKRVVCAATCASKAQVRCMN